MIKILTSKYGDMQGYNAETNTFYISMKANKEGDYENGCVMQIEGLENLKDKVYAATCCYCQDNAVNGESVDMSKKVIIIVDGSNGSYEAKMKNQEEQG